MWMAGGWIRVDTYFLTPSESKAIFGVAAPQRVSQATVIALADPTNRGPLLLAVGGALIGCVANLPMPQVSTQIHIPSPLLSDAYGDSGSRSVTAQPEPKLLPAPGQSSFSDLPTRPGYERHHLIEKRHAKLLDIAPATSRPTMFHRRCIVVQGALQQSCGNYFPMGEIMASRTYRGSGMLIRRCILGLGVKIGWKLSDLTSDGGPDNEDDCLRFWYGL